MFCALMLGLLGKGTHSGSWRSSSVIKFIPGCTCANGKSASAWILSNTITWTPVRSFGFENGHSFCCHQQLREATVAEGVKASFGHKPLKQKKTWSRIHMPCWGLSWRQGCDSFMFLNIDFKISANWAAKDTVSTLTTPPLTRK